MISVIIRLQGPLQFSGISRLRRWAAGGRTDSRGAAVFFTKTVVFVSIAIFLVAPKAREMPRCLSLPKHDPGFFPAQPGEDCAAGQWPVWRRAGHRDYNCKQYLLVKSIETSNLKTFFGKHIQKGECPVSSVEHLMILKEAIAFYKIDLCIHSLPWFDVAILGCLLRNALVWTNTTTSGKRLMVSYWEATMADRSGPATM